MHNTHIKKAIISVQTKYSDNVEKTYFTLPEYFIYFLPKEIKVPNVCNTSALSILLSRYCWASS